MYFKNEVREVKGYGEINHGVKLRPQELKLAEQLVESLSQDFRIENYHDTFQENLKALIEAKRKGETIAEERPVKRAPVIDMMEALKKSLGEGRRAAAAARLMPAKSASTGHHRQRRKAS